MNSVVHFEMPVEDRDRAAAFYESVFGWQTQKMGEEMGNYVVVTTTASDPQTGRPNEAGAINGGLYVKDKAKTDQYPSVVLAVDDMEVAMTRVKTGGGQIIGEPVAIPGVGTYVSFLDTEGNRASMLKPQM